MHFFSHNIGDFDKATRHLNRIERSIYRDLMDVYYDTELPLTLDRTLLCRRIIARTNEEVTAVEQVLNEFFIETPAGWVHVRCELELDRYRASTSQKSTAGKASAAKRAILKQHALNGNPTHVEQTFNGDPTKQETVNSKRKPSKTLKPSSPAGDGTAFDQFWTAYPHKVGKVDARKAWAKLKADSELLAAILAAIEAQKQGAAWRQDDGQYIPHPASWLNGGRWLDEVRPYVERKVVELWWVSKESMIAKGLTFDPPIVPLAGDLIGTFRHRIEEALERAGRPEERRQATPYVPPMPANGDSDLSNEQRASRMAELKGLMKSMQKPAAEAGE